MVVLPPPSSETPVFDSAFDEQVIADTGDVEANGVQQQPDRETRATNGSLGASGVPDIPIQQTATDAEQESARQLNRRQVQMIAIGAAIGNGLLIQSGKALYLGGPVSLFLAYIFIGTVMYSIMITLGEMISLLPVTGGFIALANRCLSGAIGLLCGWSYWFAYSIGFAAQLVALQNIIEFWDPDAKLRWLWVIIFWIAILGINLFNVRKFADVGFFLTVLKVLLIVGLILLGILLPMGAATSKRRLGTIGSNAGHNLTAVPCNLSELPCLETPGFLYWDQGAFLTYIFSGPFGRLVGFWQCACQAAFSYLGVEMIGIAANETKYPRKNLPPAVKRASYRILFYYVGAILVLGLNVSVLDPILKYRVENSSYISPFILLVERAGIAHLPDIINAGALIAAFSVANINLYMSSRTLHALAEEGQAPSFFKMRSWGKVPVFCVVASSLIGLLALLSAPSSGDSTLAFSFLDELTVICAMLPWAVICATYSRFRRAAKLQSKFEDIPSEAKSPFQPLLAYYGVVMSSLIIIFLGYGVFTRHKLVWGQFPDHWGISIAPWMTMVAFLLVILTWWLLNGRDFKVPRLARVDLRSGAFTAGDTNGIGLRGLTNGSPTAPELIPFLSRTSDQTTPPGLAHLRASDQPTTQIPLQTPAQAYSLGTVRPAQDPLLKRVVIWILNTL